jgi:hypothetical protein
VGEGLSEAKGAFKMKLREKIGLTVLMVCVGCVFGAARADTLTSSIVIDGDLNSHTFSANVGGEYVISKIVGVNYDPGLAWVHANSFQTFCVDYAINFVPGSQYWTQVANGASFGGVNNGFNPLNPEVAYLFTRFTKGNLDHYDYVPGSGRVASATELQMAIWSLQHDLDAPGLTNGDQQAKDWISEAVNAVTSGSWSGLGDVQVLQLWTNSTNQDFAHAAQDQLVMGGLGSGQPLPVVPLPAPVWGIVGLMGALLAWRVFGPDKTVAA